MKQQKCFLYAYAAGLVDGEGCIMIVKCKSCLSRPKPCNYFYSKLVVGMLDREGIDVLQGLFGGRINSYMWGEKMGYYWVIQANKALEPLKKLYPFLRVKKAQAEVAIALQTRVSNHFSRRTITPEELKVREHYFNKIKELRKSTPRAAVETKRDDFSLRREEAIVQLYEKPIIERVNEQV